MFVVSRGLLLVKPIETGESLPGGAILLIADARNRMTANQCEVLAVGAFAACDDEECERAHMHVRMEHCEHGSNSLACCDELLHAHPVRIGDWLLVEPRSYIDGPEPERKEWYVHQDKVVAIFGTATETETT